MENTGSTTRITPVTEALQRQRTVMNLKPAYATKMNYRPAEATMQNAVSKTKQQKDPNNIKAL